MKLRNSKNTGMTRLILLALRETCSPKISFNPEKGPNDVRDILKSFDEFGGDKFEIKDVEKPIIPPEKGILSEKLRKIICMIKENEFKIKKNSVIIRTRKQVMKVYDQSLKKLFEDKLVIKKPLNETKSVNEIYLTDKGWEKSNDIFNIHQDIIKVYNFCNLHEFFQKRFDELEDSLKTAKDKHEKNIVLKELYETFKAWHDATQKFIVIARPKE